eukprot:2283174-Alexandrium_andersonii.AAC.1
MAGARPSTEERPAELEEFAAREMNGAEARMDHLGVVNEAMNTSFQDEMRRVDDRINASVVCVRALETGVRAVQSGRAQKAVGQGAEALSVAAVRLRDVLRERVAELTGVVETQSART